MSSPTTTSTATTTPLPSLNHPINNPTLLASEDETDSSYIDWTDTEDMSEPSYSPRQGYGVAMGAGRTMRRNISARGLPGSRKYRRWLNLAALEIAEATMFQDEEDHQADRHDRQGVQSRYGDYELGGRKKAKQTFYEPKPSTFQRLFESNQNYIAWQSFIEVTEELQDQLLHTHNNEVKSVKAPPEIVVKTPKKIDDHLNRCFVGVQKRDTGLMKNFDFITEMESELREFIALTSSLDDNPALLEAFSNPELVLTANKKTTDKNVRALEEDISREERREIVYEQLVKMMQSMTRYTAEGYQLPNMKETIPEVKPLEHFQSRTQIGTPCTMRLIIESNFVRLLANGLCRFYRLVPKNQVVKGPKGEDIHLVIVTNTHKVRNPPAISLSSFIKSKGISV